MASASSTAPSVFWMARFSPRRRLLLTLPILAAVLMFSGVVAIGSGASPIPVDDTAQILLHSVGAPLDPSIPASQVTIVQQVRLPRILLAMLVGAGLAVSGTVMQGVFRNGLADPGILGVSAGGSAGAVLAFVSGLALAGMWIVPVSAFAGAVIAALVVYLLSLEHGRTRVTMLLLAGIAVNAFLAALISVMLLMTDEYAQAQVILNWLIGGLAGRGWRHLGVVVVPLLAALVATYGYSRDLNLLLMGEDTAQGLGTNVARSRFTLLALSALATGVAVSVAGPISFVGLVVPHLLRLLIGPDHRVLIPASALAGAAFLVVADTVARLAISYQEMPVGVVTGLLGGPFFLFLLWRARRSARLL